MNVKDYSQTLSTPRPIFSTQENHSANHIIPKHKKSMSSLHNMISFTPFTENKILTATTPRRLAEAHYKQKDFFDSEFNKTLDRNFKENLETQEKKKKFEERKRREEEFLALKEAKTKILLEQKQREKDDFKREQERLRRNQLSVEEKKMKESQFQKDRRGLYIEYINVKRKMQWEGQKRERELSVDHLRVRREILFN